MTDPVTPIAAPVTPVPRVAPRPTAASTAEAFEAVFLGQMAQLMIGSLESDGEFSGGHAEEMFRGVLGERIGNAVAARGGIGLAPQVMEQIMKLQEGQRHVD